MADFIAQDANDPVKPLSVFLVGMSERFVCLENVFRPIPHFGQCGGRAGRGELIANGVETTDPWCVRRADFHHAIEAEVFERLASAGVDVGDFECTAVWDEARGHSGQASHECGVHTGTATEIDDETFLPGPDAFIAELLHDGTQKE